MPVMKQMKMWRSHQKWDWQIRLCISSGKNNEQHFLVSVIEQNFCRGLRHRNLSAIRHATQRGLHQLQQLGAHSNNNDPHAQRNHTSPLIIQGLRTNAKGKITQVKQKLIINFFCTNFF